MNMRREGLAYRETRFRSVIGVCQWPNFAKSSIYQFEPGKRIAQSSGDVKQVPDLRAGT